MKCRLMHHHLGLYCLTTYPVEAKINSIICRERFLNKATLKSSTVKATKSATMNNFRFFFLFQSFVKAELS